MHQVLHYLDEPAQAVGEAAKLLRPAGRLVIVEADEHTGYGRNQCVNDVVHTYLFDLDAPDDNTECV